MRPSELNLVTSVLQAYCRATDIKVGTSQYDAAAADAVAFFQMGWRTRAELKLILESREPRR